MKKLFFEKRIWYRFASFLTSVSILITLSSLLIDFPLLDIPQKGKPKAAVFILIAFVIVYISLVFYEGVIRNSIKFTLGESVITVKFGDLFDQQNSLKVIPFNEYFDTQVDDDGTVIATKTLNGQFINKYYPDEDRIHDLDRRISSDQHLQTAINGQNASRRDGKKISYTLGSVFKDNDYLLLALTHFDEENKAYFGRGEYTQCLYNFWKNVDGIHAGRTVAMPICGSGITRFNDCSKLSTQEMLEHIILTFKSSDLTLPDLRIVVHESKRRFVNLLSLKDFQR